MAAKTLLIVYHSSSGGTRSLVEAVLRGQSSCDMDIGVDVVCQAAHTVEPDQLLRSHALIFASPENFGYMSGLMKDFFDRCFYPCENALQGRPYTTLICAGNDGTGAQTAIDRIVTGWRLRKIHPGLIARRVGGAAGSSRGHLAEADLAAATQIGALFIEGLAGGVF